MRLTDSVLTFQAHASIAPHEIYLAKQRPRHGHARATRTRGGARRGHRSSGKNVSELPGIVPTRPQPARPHHPHAAAQRPSEADRCLPSQATAARIARGGAAPAAGVVEEVDPHRLAVQHAPREVPQHVAYVERDVPAFARQDICSLEREDVRRNEELLRKAEVTLHA